MPLLDNPRHERFAQELAKGKSADEAYAAAGYSANRSNAARMNANELVRSRVAQLLTKAQERTLVTIESITTELEEARLLAMKDEKGASAAVAASMGKAKLHGLLVERSENVNLNYDVTDEPATEDEWAAEHAPAN